MTMTSLAIACHNSFLITSGMGIEDACSITAASAGGVLAVCWCLVRAKASTWACLQSLPAKQC